MNVQDLIFALSELSDHDKQLSVNIAIKDEWAEVTECMLTVNPYDNGRCYLILFEES